MPNAVSVPRNRAGSGVPSNTLGKNGDTYLNTDNAKLYYKLSGAWTAGGQIAISVTNLAASFICPDSTTREATLSNP